MRVVQSVLSMSRGAALAAASALLVAAGCAGGDSGGGSGGAAGTTTTHPARGGGSAAPAPSAGCDGAATAQADTAEETMSDPADPAGPRRWLVSAPRWEPGADPLPLVLDFHGLSEGADIHSRMTGMGALGTEKGFVTVFPHGTGVPVRWDLGADPAAGDLAYVGKVLDKVESERCIDTSRVYATGLS